MFLTATATESASRLDLFVGTGLPTLLIGMLAVFAILGIIFLALVIMRAGFKRNAIKAKKARKARKDMLETISFETRHAGEDK